MIKSLVQVCGEGLQIDLLFATERKNGKAHSIVENGRGDSPGWALDEPCSILGPLWFGLGQSLQLPLPTPDTTPEIKPPSRATTEAKATSTGVRLCFDGA